jgi:hypothetical protein
VGFLSIPAIQTSLGSYATGKINNTYGTDIKIEKVGLQFNGDVELKTILIKDHFEATMISVSELNTSILSFAKIANNAPVYVTPLGGFSGFTANVHYYSDALNPQQAYNIYREGYGGSGIGGFPYEVQVSYLKDGEQKGSFTI